MKTPAAACDATSLPPSRSRLHSSRGRYLPQQQRDSGRRRSCRRDATVSSQTPVTSAFLAAASTALQLGFRLLS